MQIVPFAIEYGYLPAMVLIFLVIDLLIEIESLPALIGNFFFWLYWLVYSIAAETALYLLGNATQPAIAGLPKPILILIAIAGTTTVLQSLTFKIGGKRVLDLSQYLDDYRRKVIASSAILEVQYGRKRVLRLCRMILKKVSYVPEKSLVRRRCGRFMSMSCYSARGNPPLFSKR
jgi:hypothetical protein